MEYLNFEFSGGIVDRLGAGHIITYWRELRRRRTSPNGVFGYKVFLSNYLRTMEQHPELLKHMRGNKVIFLRRRDKVAQAVSHVRAVQTGSWFAGAPEREQPVYDFRKLLGFHHYTHQQDLRWERAFELTETDPLRLVYEDVVADPDGAVRAVCDFLGVEHRQETGLPQVELTKPQSDGLSAEWKERFRRELEDWKLSRAARSSEEQERLVA
jgi:LPS sulfotransferase NodH